MTILGRAEVEHLAQSVDDDTVSIRLPLDTYRRVVDTMNAYHSAVDIIQWMVEQHAYLVGDTYETGALSVNRDAFNFLVAAGRAEFVGEPFGRMATIRLIGSNS